VILALDQETQTWSNESQGLGQPAASALFFSLPVLFYVGFFQDRVSQTISLGWAQIMILLISAS
jgi:hypothetical protein